MAGRPSTKSTNTNKVETKVDDTKIVKDIDSDIKKENEELKTQLANLMKMMEQMQSNQINSYTVNKDTTPNNTEFISEELPDIDMNKRITITSLTTGGVNLRTTMDGTARIFRLDKLGQSIPIIYSDLLNCINLQRDFFEDGLVYINDTRVVSDNYLEESYKKFLDINKINNIMNFDIETIKTMVSNTTDSIQETIILLIADKINKGEFVDMNKVDAIGKSCKNPIDIREVANKIR